MPQCCLSHRTQLWLIFLTLLFFSTVQADILVFSAADRHQIEEEFRDMPARFGGQIPPEGIKGMIVYADPQFACSNVKGPPNITGYDGKWILLTARFNCSFEIKVRMAQTAGYDAVIVHNVNSEELEPMSAKDSVGIEIPSVFVSELTGLILKGNYLYNHLYFVLINDDLPFNINTHLLLPFAIVVGLCFLIMVIFMIVNCIKDRRRQRRHRLPNSSLKKIPTHKYTKGDPYETCAICLDDYIEGEKLRVLPCAHAYHSKCIDPWLTKNRRVCPVCKRKVFAADERVITDSESDSDADDSTPLIRNGHSGTQGGTFAAQRENPFTRALAAQSENPLPRGRRSKERQDDSNSSSDSELSALLASDSDDYRSFHNGESSGTMFTVSDSHSINGEVPDLERSVSSTKPHTINVYNDDEEEAPLTVHALTRNTAGSQNRANLNSAELPATEIRPSQSERNQNVV